MIAEKLHLKEFPVTGPCPKLRITFFSISNAKNVPQVIVPSFPVSQFPTTLFAASFLYSGRSAKSDQLIEIPGTLLCLVSQSSVKFHAQSFFLFFEES